MEDAVRERARGGVVGHLACLDTARIAEWLELFLRFGISTPGQLVVRDDLCAAVFVEQVWDRIDTAAEVPEDARVRLKGHIKEAVAQLLQDWSGGEEDEQYWRELLVLIADINCHGCLDALLDIADDGPPTHGDAAEELHRELLSVVFSAHLSAREERAAEQASRIRALTDFYIDQPGYSALAIDRACRTDPQSTADYVRRYVRASMLDRPQDVEDTLVAMHTSMGVKHFQDNIAAIRAALVHEARYVTPHTPRAYYKRYVTAIARLCTFELRLAQSECFESDLVELLAGADNPSGTQGTELIARWHPPYREGMSAEFPVTFPLELIDFRVMGLHMPNQSELSSRLLSASRDLRKVAE